MAALLMACLGFKLILSLVANVVNLMTTHELKGRMESQFLNPVRETVIVLEIGA